MRTDENEDIGHEFDELDELQHAYVITVHRSRGSEYPAVVVPLTMSAYTRHDQLVEAISLARRSVKISAGVR